MGGREKWIDKISTTLAIPRYIFCQESVPEKVIHIINFIRNPNVHNATVEGIQTHNSKKKIE